MNKKLTSHKKTLVVFIAIVVVAMHIFNVTLIRESGDISALAAAVVAAAMTITAVLFFVRQNKALRKQNDAVRAQNESLRKQNDAVRRELEVLHAQNESLRKQSDAVLRELDREKSLHGRCKREYRDYQISMDDKLLSMHESCVALKTHVANWSNRYFALRKKCGMME